MQVIGLSSWLLQGSDATLPGEAQNGSRARGRGARRVSPGTEAAADHKGWVGRPAEHGGMRMKNTATNRAINGMVRRIVERFDPERVILFGSHARGTADPDSDVDLLVVMSHSGSKREKQLEIRLALHEFPLSKDIIVTTPEEFAWRRKVPGTIERPAAREGKLLYARS